MESPFQSHEEEAEKLSPGMKSLIYGFVTGFTLAVLVIFFERQISKNSSQPVAIFPERLPAQTEQKPILQDVKK